MEAHCFRYFAALFSLFCTVLTPKRQSSENSKLPDSSKTGRTVSWSLSLSFVRSTQKKGRLFASLSREGVNHCTLHCRLAKVRGLMYGRKYRAVIGRETLTASVALDAEEAAGTADAEASAILVAFEAAIFSSCAFASCSCASSCS